MSISTASRLDALIGLNSAKRIVLRVARGDTGAHALLLYGARGAGKSILARALAQAWMCAAPSELGADGTCRACAAFERDSCADFLFIAPTGGSSIIRANAIGTEEKGGPVPLLEFFRTRPLTARNRVVMIEQAHRMNSFAYNALLKTLEEPSPTSKLVLTTDAIGEIPATILSRCLAVACALPDPAAVHDLYPQALEMDILLSDGAPGRTQHILAHPEPYREIVQFARNLGKRSAGEALVVAEEFRRLCEGLEKALALGARASNTEALEALSTALARDPNAPAWWTAACLEAHRRIIANVNPSFVFDALFTSISGTK